MNVSIVIVNWNSGNQLRECLASIAHAGKRLPPSSKMDRVIVVDNGSTDGSDRDLDRHDLELRLLRNRENRGFAAACNQGAAEVLSDLILFLNPDTRLFADSLAVPLAHLCATAHADVGIVGIQLIDDTRTVTRSCARFPTLLHFASHALGLDRLLPSASYFMREWDHAHTRDVDHVIGAFFMMRLGLFNALGGFDDTFFVYFEDLDLSLRARRAGWRNVYLTAAQAYHKGGGTSAQVLGRRLFYSLHSRLQYGRKHFSRPQRILLAWITWLVEPPMRIIHLVLTARFKEIAYTLEAYWLLATETLPPRRQ